MRAQGQEFRKRIRSTTWHINGVQLMIDASVSNPITDALRQSQHILNTIQDNLERYLLSRESNSRITL